VTHYVADIRKARELLDWQPATALDQGIPKAVGWFREWRSEHPFDEKRPHVDDRAGEIPHGFKAPAGAA
jgi:dTDP-D-glucose 4,6-dehydratase